MLIVPGSQLTQRRVELLLTGDAQAAPQVQRSALQRVRLAELPSAVVKGSWAATPLGKPAVPVEPAARLFDALNQRFKVPNDTLRSPATDAKVRKPRGLALLNACSRNSTYPVGHASISTPLHSSR